MRLILVRHGESEWNREGRILGGVDVELSELGRRQAQALARALQRERIQVVYCSPLKRAVDTGKLISNAHGCALTPDPDLLELNRGNLEGMTREEAVRMYPNLQESWPEVSAIPGLYGQESLYHLAVRVRKSVDRIIAKHSGETVALVAHYFVNLLILLGFLELEPQCFRYFGQDIGAISIVEIENDRSRICLLNDTCHLPKG
jgi:broad specificity phosphatase PhoE